VVVVVVVVVVGVVGVVRVEVLGKGMGPMLGVVFVSVVAVAVLLVVRRGD
jgi:hypothetical protein